jgi:hypothetical protein
MKKGLIFAAIVVLFVVFTITTKASSQPISVLKDEVASKFEKNIDYSKAKNLMIVAHPDDETIWGADHLIEEDYLVVCVTCGTNKTRDKEIARALSISDDELIKLGYPDNPGGVISDWSDEKEDIINDLKEIILMKNYDKIVTHNPTGEYGHPQHIMLNKFVTQITKEYNLTDELYYFSKYYSKDKQGMIDTEHFPIKNYNKKMKEMASVYKSQAHVINNFKYLMGSEKWQKYTEMMENNQ